MRPRVIPVLLLDRRRRLVKTQRFGEPTYVGDPFNVIRIFNEKEVDEICVLDIDVGADGRQPDVGFIAEMASECFTPMSYGGGISSPADAAPILAAGVEKVVLGRAGANAEQVRALASSFGAQAVAACVDYRDSPGGGRVFLDRGRVDTEMTPEAYARAAVAAGAGEIILQCIDRDGMRAGYDTTTIVTVAAAVSVPVVALGGAGELAHLVGGLHAGASAVASGSAFVFIGRLRAVLISYPTPGEIDAALAATP